jgi:MFS transporter, PAT family, beta-lactamase induction signal transducer AmpG
MGGWVAPCFGSFAFRPTSCYKPGVTEADAKAGGGLLGWVRRRWWIFTIYYAEGFPASLVRQFVTAYFKEHGASLQATGLTSLFNLPWTIKFLWAPFVDAYATKRRWLLLLEGSVVAGIVVLALASASPEPLLLGAAVFMVLAFVSATHDIAIDGYYLERLDRTDQARYVGVQSFAYRLAMISAGGGVLWLCGQSSWLVGYLAAAAVLGGVWALHAAALPRFEEPRRPLGELVSYLARPRTLALVGATIAVVAGLKYLLALQAVQPVVKPLARVSMPGWIAIALLLAMAVLGIRAKALKQKLYASGSPYALAFVDYLDQPRIALVLAFIVTFRVGEALLQSLAYPFLKDIGISPQQYALAHNTFGLIATFVGTILGGALIARFGLKRCLPPFVLVFNTLHFLYMYLAVHYDLVFQRPDLGRANFLLVCAVVSVESFAVGCGNAAFTVFIMRTTKQNHKAAQFAIGTGLMNVAGTLAGVVSGFIAARVGFAAYFAFTFLAALPNLFLIPFLPLDGEPANGGRA